MHSVLNESSFLDALGDIASSVQKKREKNKETYMYGSISNYTKKLILSFPVICDNTIPISTAQMISKAHEKELVSMFEMLFTSMALSGTNGIEILQTLHQNLTDSSSIDEIIDAIEKSVGESTIYSKAELRDIINEMTHYLKYEQKSLPVNSFSERSLNDYIVRESYNGSVITEKTYTDKDIEAIYKSGKDSILHGYESDEHKWKKEDNENDDPTQKEKRANKEYDRRERAKNAEYNRRERKKNQREDYVRKQDQERRDIERAEDKAQRQKERQDDIRFKLAQSRVKDIDYKKANELQPTLMNVQYIVVDQNGNNTEKEKVFTAGIKARLVGSDAMEIIERLSAANENKMTFKDLIRATTGEISLVKDFFLAIKQAKINAKNAAKRGDSAKMWNLLAARAQKNKVSGTMRSNDASAISTLLINQETVNYLQNQYNLNLESPKEASRIMEAFNLMAFVIADETNEVAKFLYHGNGRTGFEMIAYSSLSKDMRDDKNYNKTINLLNKAGR